LGLGIKFYPTTKTDDHRHGRLVNEAGEVTTVYLVQDISMDIMRIGYEYSIGIEYATV